MTKIKQDEIQNKYKSKTKIKVKIQQHTQNEIQ